MMLNWIRKHKYFSTSGAYTICWTGGEPTVYTASFRKKAILYTRNYNEALAACETHENQALEDFKYGASRLSGIRKNLRD